MLLGSAFSLFGGLALGALVNLLADRLPPRAETSARAPTPLGIPHLLRVVLVETLLAGAAIYLWLREGVTLLAAVDLLYIALFVLIAVIDIEHRLVLRSVMLPAFAFALLEVLFSGRIRPLDALAGFAISQIVLTAFYLLGEAYLRFINARREEPVEEVAFGSGDVTLGTFCGLVVGFPRVVPMLILMVFLGAALALLFLVVRLILLRRYEAHIPMPYGPAILLAAALLLLWGPAVARLFGAH